MINALRRSLPSYHRATIPYEAGGISMSQRVSSFDSEPRDRILLNSMSKREIAFDRKLTHESGDECADSIIVYM